MPNISSNVERLRELDCCAVSDAFDRLNLKGVVSGVPQRSGEGKIAGQVITVKLHTGEPPPGPPRHLGTTAIELGNNDNVIVVEQHTGIEAGSWGGILTLGAQCKGIEGVIADGPVRDIDEAVDYKFPIFSSALTAITARGRITEAGTNIPINVWGVEVAGGDYVIADQSAIIFINSNNIDQVLDTAATIVAKEKDMAKAVRAGIPISEVMGGNYEHMLKDAK